MTVVKLHHLTTGHLSFYLLPPPQSHVFLFSFFFPTPYATLSPSSKFCSLFSLPTPALFLVPPLIILHSTKGTTTDSWTILGSHEHPHSLFNIHSIIKFQNRTSFFSCTGTWRKFTQSLARLDWMWQSERATQASALIRSEIKSPQQLQGALGLGNFTVCHLQRSLWNSCDKTLNPEVTDGEG